MKNNKPLEELIEAVREVTIYVKPCTSCPWSMSGDRALKRLNEAFKPYRDGFRKPTTDDFRKGNPQWEDNSIQFPRLIAECEAAGFFDQSEPALVDCFAAVCDGMDLRGFDLAELIERAQAEWEEIKLKWCPLPKKQWAIGDVVCDMHDGLNLPEGCELVSKTTVSLSGGHDIIQKCIESRIGGEYLYTNKYLVLTTSGEGRAELMYSYDDNRFGIMIVKGLV